MSTVRASTPAGDDIAAEQQAEDLLDAQRGSEGLSEVTQRKGVAPDEGNPESPPTRSFQPSSIGLTVLLPRDARQLQPRVSSVGGSKRYPVGLEIYWLNL